MKGRDLVKYIQLYGLEDHDFPICGEDGMFVNFITIEDASRTYHVPISNIRTMIRDKKLNVVRILNKELIDTTEAETCLSGYSQTYQTNTHKWKERVNNEFSRKRAN